MISGISSLLIQRHPLTVNKLPLYASKDKAKAMRGNHFSIYVAKYKTVLPFAAVCLCNKFCSNQRNLKEK